MKIYVASSWKNEQQPQVVEILRRHGHEVYDFRNPAPGNHGFGWKQCVTSPPPWSAYMTRMVLEHPVAEEGFRFDFGAMRWADAIVMLQPCGRSASLEAGWGAGAGKLTIALLTDGQEPELMLKMCDHICISLDEVVGILARAKQPPQPTRGINQWAGEVFETAKSKGWYDNGPPPFAERLALIHSEVSEALEEFRNGHDLTEVRVENGKPEGVPIELADVVIRVMDLCAAHGIDLEAAIREKAIYNASRPHKHGGKRF